MVYLRDWQVEDALEFHRLSMDPFFKKRRLKQYLYPDTFLNTITILETYRDVDKKQFLIQAIIQNSKICGYIQCEKKEPFSCELSYWVGSNYWNHGIATQAIQLMCSHVFAQLSIYQIYARVKKENHASKKALLHNGFQAVEENDDIIIFYRYR